MSSKQMIVGVRRLVHRSALLQVGLLLLFWLAGEAVVRGTGLPLPGGVVGMRAGVVGEEAPHGLPAPWLPSIDAALRQAAAQLGS